VLSKVFYKNREVAAKPGMGSCYDAGSCSSSLPALMDSYITFDQTQTHADESQQVPCFSIFNQNQNQNQNQTDPIFTHISTTMEPTTFKGLPNMGSCLDPFSCDKKVLKAVLSQLSNMDSNPNLKGSPSLGGGSSESYLSDVGMPNIWNYY
jgi:hypothetical protein